MALFVVVNYFGVRWFARINNALVGWKLFIILLVIVSFFVAAFHGQNFSSHGFAPSGVHGIFTAIATSGIVFSYLGFRQGIELAGETDNPRRNVPIAVIGSVLLTGLIYVLLQVAFIGALDPGTLAKSGSWADLSFANDFGPLAALATALGLGWLAFLLYVDAIVSPGDTGLIYTTITSRISFAMARNGNAPKVLERTTDKGVPLVGLILAFIIGLIAFLPFPSWQQLVGFITSATVLSFASGPLVHASMRAQLPDQERPFRLPGGHTIPLLAFWGSNLIVYWSGWTTVWKLMIAVLIGFVLLGAFVGSGQMKGKSLDVRSGLWVFPWLAGLTLISYFGNYPEPAAGNLHALGFVLSAGLLLLLSSACTSWPTSCGSRPQAQAYVDETVTEAAVEDEELSPVSLRPGGVLPTVNSSLEGEVAQGDVDPGDEDRRRGDDQAVLREGPEADRMAVAGRDAEHDDIGAGADGRRVPAEVGAEGERPPGRVGAGCAVARLDQVGDQRGHRRDVRDVVHDPGQHA